MADCITRLRLEKRARFLTHGGVGNALEMIMA